jgi:hypothetical protein
MERVEKVAVLNNEVEARLVDKVLSEQKIPHVMRSYHDTAYDGLFQGPGDWGHVEAPVDLHERVKAIIDELRRQQSSGYDGEGETEGGE